MALIDKVKQLLDKLSDNGWRDLLLEVTGNKLDIKQENSESLREELLKPIETINRNIKGFDDFRLDGNQGITPLSFSKSLLYHALASSSVIDSTLSYYPSLKELDLIENYIYSTSIQNDLNVRNLEGLKKQYGSKLCVAVFAYQYKTWQESSHRVHADMNYSRTGVARVGTTSEVYDAKRRSFWVGDTDGEISVLPCRYGAFLALKDIGSNVQSDFSIMDGSSRDAGLEFTVPIHKLFDGSECLNDINDVNLDFETYHRNEKLKKSHDSQIANSIPIDSSYNQNLFPFIIDDKTQPNFLYTKRNLANNDMVGSIVITPTNGAISEPAIQDDRYVAFKVPKINSINRFSSSFQIPANSGRKAPEYVNIRQIVESVDVVNPITDVKDINNLHQTEFNKKLNNGGYLAVDFIDRTGDGFIKITEFEGLTSLAAYSLITAIDYFPLVNQRDIFRWDRGDSIQQFNQGGAQPLSSERRGLRANINYTPFESDAAVTFTAVISDKQGLGQNRNNQKLETLSISYLPDAASGVYAPGWDITFDSLNSDFFFAAYGLGSPFPEDAKLCAALNSFWPAAAPDASRTFFISNTLSVIAGNGGTFDDQFTDKKPTAIPLTDQELGIHPKIATSIGVSSKVGWDGEYGPFLEANHDGEHVNYADIARSDYTRNAWKGSMHMDIIKNVTTSQLIKRMEALQKCILELLQPTTDTIISNDYWLVSFEEIDDWSFRGDRMSNQLKNSGFRFVFIIPEGNQPQVDKEDISRLKMKVDKKFECQLDDDTFLWREITPIHRIAMSDSDMPEVNFISQLW